MNRSAAIVCQGLLDSSWGLRVYGVWAFPYFWQMEHLLTSSSMSLFMPCQKILALARSWHLVTPWLASCTLWRYSSLSLCGMMIRGPFSMMPFSMDSSSLNGQYFRRDWCTSLLSSGQPSSITSRNAHSSVSWEVDVCISWSFWSENITKSICMCGSLDSSGSGLSLDMASKRSISFPGLYLTFMLYPCSRSRNLCNLGGAEPRFFRVIISRGLWSDRTVNSLPYTYAWNFSQA